MSNRRVRRNGKRGLGLTGDTASPVRCGATRVLPTAAVALVLFPEKGRDVEILSIDDGGLGFLRSTREEKGTPDHGAG